MPVKQKLSEPKHPLTLKTSEVTGIRSIRDIPELQVSCRIRPPGFFDSERAGIFHYQSKSHKNHPHVVKFSGGKTSGMLLFILLEAGLLEAERGDVVLFNNTSAEHPKTYEFVERCKHVVEERYKIPFFWIEYQTYEDARQGEYVRLPSFKLVNQEPCSKNNPDGYHHRGEVFEEMLSYKGYVPTLFQRVCTQSLKLECSRDFLGEWLANKQATERLGHFGESSRLDDAAMYARYKKNRGLAPREIFFRKKAFLKSRPWIRASQKWSDYSDVAVPFTNTGLAGKAYGRKARFGEGGIEYISFVGIRRDEMRRVIKIQKRNAGEADTEGYEGEHVYMPLAEMGIAEGDVHDFWEKQDWRLDLKKEDNLSNCTFCFLKGVENLKAAKEAIKKEQVADYANTPCDVRWWAAIERKYGRNMKAEGRKLKPKENDFFGFFGPSAIYGTENGASEMSYQLLAENDCLDGVDMPVEDILPCDCTE